MGSEQQVSRQQSSAKDNEDDHAVGVFWFIMAGFCFALNFIFGKLVYTSQPELLPLQLLTYRGIISTLIMALILNRRIKHVVWDSIEGS